ncbi:hypothetical protein [Streptomyces racemochromogenes]|uniref:hypothetical protein n=1 Tax=Streptomyces racemochromogenes TaxID=67353 RepID=UPI0031EAF55E
MSSSDGARWDPQSQRWEWGPAPARGAGQPAPPPGAPPGSPQPASPPPASPQQPPGGPTALPATPPPTAPGYHEAWPPVPTAPLPPPPPPPGGGQQWRTPVLVGLAAAVVGGAAVAAWMLLGPEDGAGGDARPPASPSGQWTAPEPGPSSPGPTSPSPTTPSPSPSTGGDHTVVHNDNGFSVAVPKGWEPSTDETGSGSFYRRPGDRSALLQVFRITESSAMGSCTLLQISSDQLKANPGYRQVSIEPTAGTGCELVYEYDSSESNGRRRGMERIVTTPGGGRWALLAAGPAADAATTRANLTAALESFRPD